MPTRRPHVAGSFYPANPSELRKYGESRLSQSAQCRPVSAVILPHAGYVYSGDTACSALSEIIVPEQVLLIGPDHFSSGGAFSVYGKGSWELPLGSVAVEESLTRYLFAESSLLKSDEAAHFAEHSLEVLIPLLQLKQEAFRIAPLLVGTIDREITKEAAGELGAKLKAMDKPPLVVISNDMNHYENDERTRRKDRYALEAIENLDAEALFKVVREHQISMCGFGPVYMLLNMVEALGIKKATLADYRTSAEVSGDKDRVVGYAGFIFE